MCFLIKKQIKVFCIYALLYTVTTVSLSLDFYGLLVYNMQHLVYH